ncbi:MAG: NUMOD4 motif-containing HNH endonuclease [Bacteroidia bacterium]
MTKLKTTPNQKDARLLHTLETSCSITSEKLNLENEIWVDIVGYPEFVGYVKVSNYGRVKSTVLGRHKKEKIRKFNYHRFGYLQMPLSANGKRKNIYVHRLVATSFIDNPFNKPDVNHKDGNKLNNNVENLEWVTHSENVRHAMDKLGFDPGVSVRGKFLRGDAHNAKQIAMFTFEGELIDTFQCMVDAEEITGFNSIAQALDKQNRTCGGFIWKSIKGYDNYLKQRNG